MIEHEDEVTEPPATPGGAGGGTGAGALWQPPLAGTPRTGDVPVGAAVPGTTRPQPATGTPEGVDASDGEPGATEAPEERTLVPAHWRADGPAASGTDPSWVPTGDPGGVAPGPIGMAGVVPPERWGSREASQAAGPRKPGGGLWRVAVVALVAALIGAGAGGGIVAAVSAGNGSTDITQISTGPALLNGTVSIQSVLSRVLPAVVSIDAKSTQAPTVTPFGYTQPGSVQEDQGTGMIITSSGEVVTNNHVIAGATTITVTLYGQTKALPATLIDTDPTDDVALLKITGASGLPTVHYGNSDQIQVGDSVIAIGNALGLSQGTPTVTQGIISAKGRTVQAGDAATGTTETLTSMLQTDAAINPGNSGGPLVDSKGQVVGMNTAVAASATGGGQAQNIGFAIPSNKITQLLPDLRNRSIGSGSGQQPGYMGVSLVTVTPSIQQADGLTPSSGALVVDVVSGSPAASAGIQQGDVIVSLNGKTIVSADQLATAIEADHAGDSVTLGIYRGSSKQTIKVILGARPGQGITG